MKRQISLVLVSGLFLSASAFADSTYWGLGPNAAGTYSYAGGTAKLYGTNIEVVDVQGIGTPSNSGPINTLGIVGGLMSFTSGLNTGGWSWGNPGTLSITGCIAGLLGTVIGSGPTATCSNAQTLVSDEFTSVSIIGGPDGTGFEFGSLHGSINSLLAAHFGVSPAFIAPNSKLKGSVIGLPTDINGFAITGASFSAHPDNPAGQLNLVPDHDVTHVVAAEEWNLSSTLSLFGFAAIAFVAARRFGWIVKAA